MLAGDDRPLCYSPEGCLFVDTPCAVPANSEKANPRPTPAHASSRLDPNAVAANRLDSTDCSADVRSANGELLYVLDIAAGETRCIRSSNFQAGSLYRLRGAASEQHAKE